MIFVTVGSRNYPFDRLFKKLDELYEKGVLTDSMFAQIGTSTYKPKHYEYKDFISQGEFLEKVKEADGEHINDHQIQNNEAFNLNRYVLMADLELENLGECFQKIYDGTDELVPWVNKDPMAIVNMIDKFIQENWCN